MKLKFLALLCIVLLLSGCADSVNLSDVQSEDVGFFFGLWHGVIAPFAFLWSLFDDTVAVYAVYNNGGAYDFGFLLGVGALVSGSSR